MPNDVPSQPSPQVGPSKGADRVSSPPASRWRRGAAGAAAEGGGRGAQACSHWSKDLAGCPLSGAHVITSWPRDGLPRKFEKARTLRAAEWRRRPWSGCSAAGRSGRSARPRRKVSVHRAARRARREGPTPSPRGQRRPRLPSPASGAGKALPGGLGGPCAFPWGRLVLPSFPFLSFLSFVGVSDIRATCFRTEEKPEPLPWLANPAQCPAPSLGC